MPPPVIDTPEVERVPPASFLQKCPETLQETGIDKELWDSMTLEQQVMRLRNHVVISWVPQYFSCMLTHNALVDWHTKAPEE